MKAQRLWETGLTAVVAAILAVTTLTTARADAPNLPPSQDPFYTYTGSTPLASIAPGTVLKSRTSFLHLATVPLPIQAVQLLYRTTGQLGQPTVTVATVLKPPLAPRRPTLVSYQVAYDTLGTQCDTSYALAGGGPLGVAQAEVPMIAAQLLEGHTVVTADYEGTQANWTAGLEGGRSTLDGIRAAINFEPELNPTTPVVMTGYSGGSIPTEWAAEIASSYAPELRIVGAAIGATTPDFAHNLRYIDGSLVWSSVMPAALIGLSRAARADLTPYLSAYGAAVFRAQAGKCILDILAHYPGLTMKSLLRPQYSNYLAVPAIARLLNSTIMGRHGTPRFPVLLAVGNVDGTGDGVMVARDVQQLAYTYCQHGVPVQFREYPAVEHIVAGTGVFAADSNTWAQARLAGAPAPTNCAHIKPGNPLTPLPIN